MRLLLSTTLLLVASTVTAQEAANKTAQAVLSEVDAARKLVDPTAKPTPAQTAEDAWNGVAAGADLCGSSTSPRVLAHLQRAVALACGKPAPALEDATRDVSALGANGAVAARTQATALLRGAASWSRLPQAWMHLYQARSVAAGVASPADQAKLRAQALKKSPADVLKSVATYATELGKHAENPKIAAGVQQAARDYLRRPTASGDTQSHLASIGARNADVTAFLKAAPQPAFSGAGSWTKPRADKPAANATGPVADHVKKGQTYTFVMVVDNAQMTMTTTEVWTIVEVTANAIVYDAESTMRMTFKAAGMPTMKPKTTLRQGQRYPINIPAPRGANAPKPVQTKPVGTETLEIDGLKFDCKIYLNSGTRVWVTPKFPGAIKMEGKTLSRELKSVTGLDKTSVRPKTGGKPPAAGGNQDALDVSKVKVGQNYHFKSEFDTPQMTIESDTVWTVTKITPTVIHYDLSTTTHMTMKNPPAGMPPMKPRTTVSRNQKIPLVNTAPAANDPNAPKSVGTDLIEIDGQKFPCKLYENNGIKSWISKVFPFSIIVEKKGKPLLRLVKID